MSNLPHIVGMIAVIAGQHFFGYLKNKYLGAILPILLLGSVAFFIYKGTFEFTFRDIIIPLFGLFVLFGMYQSGKASKDKKIAKELEKMKAKDILSK